MSIVYHNPDVTFTYYLLIPHQQDFRVLLAREGDLWTLPFFFPDEHHFGEVAHINQHVWQSLGLYTATLRCLMTNYSDELGEHRFYALDNLDEHWSPPQDMFWAKESDVANLPLVNRAQRRAIEHYFSWCHSDSSLRPPWMRHGWYHEAADWVVDVADRMSMGGLEAVVQERCWARSSVLKLTSDDGTLYLKAVPAMFTYEPVVTRILALRYPGHAPDVRAVHVEQGWMLTRDFNAPTLDKIADIHIWKEALRTYARIQIDLSRSVESIIGLGIPDRHLDYLGSQIERLAHDLPDELTADEKQLYKHAVSTLRSMCYELAEDHDVPLSLTHGDLWAGNIAVKQWGDPLFFDWSDASVAHPFMDIPFFLEDAPSRFPDIADARAQLRDAYLEEWTRYEPLINLRRAFELAEVLGFLHQALIYISHVLPNIESGARWEMRSMPPMLIRKALAAYQKWQTMA